MLRGNCSAAPVNYVKIDGRPFEVVELSDLLSEKAWNITFHDNEENAKHLLRISGRYYHFQKYSFWANHNVRHNATNNSGAYILVPRGDCGVYVGSTINITMRRLDHRSALSRGINKNKPLQEAFNSGKLADMSVVFIPTTDRDAAYQLEGELITILKDNFKLLNIAADPKNSSDVLPEHDERMRKIRSENAIKRFEQPGAREHMSNLSRERHADPEFKIKHSEAIKKAYEDEGTRDALGKAMAAFRNDPVRYAAYLEKMRDKVWKNEESKAKRLAGLKRFQEDTERFNVMNKRRLDSLASDEVRAKMSISAKKRHQENPEAAQAHRLKLKEMYKDPALRERQFNASAATAKPVSINGVVYRSTHEAARAVGMSKPGVVARIKSTNLKFSEWKYM